LRRHNRRITFDKNSAANFYFISVADALCSPVWLPFCFARFVVFAPKLGLIT